MRSAYLIRPDIGRGNEAVLLHPFHLHAVLSSDQPSGRCRIHAAAVRSSQMSPRSGAATRQRSLRRSIRLSTTDEEVRNKCGRIRLQISPRAQGTPGDTEQRKERRVVQRPHNEHTATSVLFVDPGSCMASASRSSAVFPARAPFARRQSNSHDEAGTLGQTYGFPIGVRAASACGLFGRTAGEVPGTVHASE
jgi:hypothetical protein